MVREESFDVVVVGGGAAGLAAAIEARAAGASVVLLEKNPALGGSTAWSIGSVTATRTPHQRARGIVDSPADHWADMPGFAGPLAGRDNDALRRLLCDDMPATFQWLLDSGVRFMGPMPEPPHRQPRMHNVLPNSRSFIYHLGRRARRAGVKIRTGAAVTGLVREQGRVVGVDVDLSGAPARFVARRGVVLAAGDFTNSPGFKSRFMGPQEAKIEGVNPTATGDGQRLAEALGARIVNGDLALGPEIRFIAPARETFVRRLPPWRWLAVSMKWSLDWLPSALLRPFMMKFLTTALAPSLALFEAGAVLVNGAASASRTSSRSPPGTSPTSRARWAGSSCPTSSPSAFPRGRTSSRPRPASPTPTFPITGATGPTCTRRRRPWANWRRSWACRPSRWRRAPSPSPASPVLSLRSARCGRCSCTAKAGSRWTPSIACSDPATPRCRVCTRPARPGRAACCSRATAITSAGPSCRAGAPAASPRRPRAADGRAARAALAVRTGA
jgi:hypothetical protein